MTAIRPTALLAAVLALAAAPAPADDAALARCGAAKITALARACGQLLASEARYRADADVLSWNRRRALIDGRLADAWARAEAGAADPRCAASTAAAPAAVSRLAAAVGAALDRAADAPCGRRLARIGRRACRAAIEAERVALLTPAGAAEARAAAAARLRARLERQWPPACASGLPAGSAAAHLLDLAAGAAGDATTRGLGAIAAESGRAIGVAVEPDEVAGDAGFAAALAHDATSLTAENAMKWGPVQPLPGQWAFAPADAAVAIADANDQRLRGHTLVWGALQLPDYVQNAGSAAELRGYVADHVAGLVGRYAGRVAQWDVVNEPLSGVGDAPTPDGLDDNVFRRLLGPGYVAEALQLARAADPHARLFVNENGIEIPGPKQDRFYTLVRNLLAAGAPLDGIGFQAHAGLIPPGQYPDRATVEASLRRFADLGLDVELTELDVTLAFRAGDLATRLTQQAEDYRGLVAACLAVPRCTGITTWGLGDRYTWLRSFFGIDDWPLPFDDDWARKPAYFAMRTALLRALFDG